MVSWYVRTWGGGGTGQSELLRTRGRAPSEGGCGGDSNVDVLTSGDMVRGRCIIELDGVVKLSQIGSHTLRRPFDRKLNKGCHELPFTLTLPKGGIPSSYKSRNATVEYTINGIIKKPEMLKLDHRAQIIKLTVEAPFIFPNLMLPRQMVSEKQLGLISNDGTVRATVNLNKQGFYPVDYIVNNRTSLGVTTSARLDRKTSIGLAVTPGIDGAGMIQVPVPMGIPLSMKITHISIIPSGHSINLIAAINLVTLP
ncbi:unnamed protein product [Medioppia subpectinata]|uniref:Arrestin-like N-terminal domain-containing protein n=1 Tax=Medioppia subpectinata TaxID=1979941 RepID=A0A7R9PYB0_9ACAR|nr:unnamed protein product [Medioppia subpectinata]CAG2104890.1 unnamed protein product [Medioppia subpectinata]